MGSRGVPENCKFKEFGVGILHEGAQGTRAHNSPNDLGEPLKQLVSPPDGVCLDRLGRGSKAELTLSFPPM